VCPWISQAGHFANDSPAVSFRLLFFFFPCLSSLGCLVSSESAKEGLKAPLATTRPSPSFGVCDLVSSLLRSFASFQKVKVPLSISVACNNSYDTMHSFMKPLIALERSLN
jgi:hypothetical protein